MVRKLAGTLATVGMLSSPLAFALGLGEAELLSSLNQPFKATIQLAQADGVSADEIRVQLADERAFAKAGLDRQFFLQNLSFTVRSGSKGPYIELSSATPVKEPFLNFLLEVEWPQGQLMREYTFLLDPPTYNNTLTQQYAQSSQSSPQLAAPAAGKMVEEGARRIKVGPTDTLWSLARKNRPDTSITIKQAMLAIQDANPDVFPTGNINNMESGSTILIPSKSAMAKRSATEAAKEVASQNKAWVAFKAKSVPAEAKTETVKAETPVESQPLKLVAEDEAPAATETTTDSAAVSQELALSKETLDQSEREKAELSGRLDELQKQVNTLQKLIRLKDEQLAAMEVMLAKQNQLLAGKSVSDEASAGESNMAEPPKASTASAATTGQATAGAIGLDLAAEVQKQTEAAKTEKPAEVKQPEPVKSFSLDKQETQELDPSSFLVDSLRKNATVIGGAAAAVLALILLLVVMRRRRKASAAESKAAASDDGMSDFATGAVAGAAGIAALDAISDDDLPDDLSLDDDLSGDLDESSLSDDAGMGDDLDSLSLDDLGEPDTLAEKSDNAIEDLGDFDLGDFDEEPAEETASAPLSDDELDLGEELELGGELDLDDLDFSEDFDLGDLDDSEEGSEDPFAKAELTQDTLPAEDADNGESVQDNLIDFEEDLEDQSDLGLVAEPVEAIVPVSADEDELIDLEGSDLSDLDLESLDDTETFAAQSEDDDILAALADEAAELEAADELISDSATDDLSVDFDLEDLTSGLEVDDEVSPEVVEEDDHSEDLLAELEEELAAVPEMSPLDEAQSYRELGQPEQAAAILQRMLGENPEDNQVRLKFMEVLVDLGDEATFDHELRQLQDVGDAKSLTSALALQQELYNKVGSSNYIAEPGSAPADDLDDLLALNSELTSPSADEKDADYELDLNRELDALERDFERYAGEESQQADDLDDVDFELTDLDLSDDIADSKPMINLDPLDLGEPEPLETDDFELTDLADLDSDDLADLQRDLMDDDNEYAFNDNQETLRSDTRDYLEDLGDLSMTANRSDALELSGMADLVGQDLADDEILDLSPNIDEPDELADLGELTDISLDDSSADADRLNIDDLLDENEDPEIKLDLARAYLDMGNNASAIEALQDVLNRGNADQKDEARELIAKLQAD